jgi:hypothetical protein
MSEHVCALIAEKGDSVPQFAGPSGAKILEENLIKMSGTLELAKLALILQRIGLNIECRPNSACMNPVSRHLPIDEPIVATQSV